MWHRTCPPANIYLPVVVFICRLMMVKLRAALTHSSSTQRFQKTVEAPSATDYLWTWRCNESCAAYCRNFLPRKLRPGFFEAPEPSLDFLALVFRIGCPCVWRPRGKKICVDSSRINGARHKCIAGSLQWPHPDYLSGKLGVGGAALWSADGHQL